MRIIVVTTDQEPLNGIFWQSYKEEDGPSPDLFFILKPRQHRSNFQKIIDPFFLFRPSSIIRLGFARYFSNPICKKDIELGLHRNVREMFPNEKFLEINSLNQASGFSKLVKSKPDILISIGKVEIFREHVLEVPEKCSINVHNGKLPEYKGLFATFWEIYQGEKEGGISIHALTKEIDAGELLAEKRIPLSGDLLDDLINKKYHGGRLLAYLLRNDLNFDKDMGKVNSSHPNYYSWPTLKHIIGFHWRCFQTYK